MPICTIALNTKKTRKLLNDYLIANEYKVDSTYSLVDAKNSDEVFDSQYRFAQMEKDRVVFLRYPSYGYAKDAFSFPQFLEIMADTDQDTEIVGYKKLMFNVFPNHTIIATLLIPKGAHRFITDSKCRAEKAIITGYFSLVTGEPIPFSPTFCSMWKNSFLYPDVGNTVVSVDSTNKPYFDELGFTCSAGIHFFRTLKEAQNY